LLDRGCELQLTARRSSIFEPARMRDAPYPARVCTPFSEIANSKFAPPYGEFDTVGFVCSVGPAPYVSSISLFFIFEFFQSSYLQLQ
jgi:hypothetical protein